MKGRRPIPTGIKLLTGRRNVNLNEPDFPGQIPECPEWLPAEGKRRWKRYSELLHAAGVLTSADDSLAALCLAWAELKSATQTLQREGRYITTGAGARIAHPAVRVQRNAWTAVREYSSLFGLEPSSRARIHGLQVQKKDRLEEFLEGTG